MTIARRFTLSFAASLAVLGLAACSGAKDAEKAEATAAPEAKPGIVISEGRMILPAVSGNPAGAYFTVQNGGPANVSIAAIAIDGVGKTEVHQTTGGQMKPVERVDVNAGTTTKFERGGLHVMAFELDGKLKAGGSTEMTVTFSDGDKVSAPLKLESMGAAMDGMSHDAMAGMDHGGSH
ncbi:MAG: copper chaperone PCu(A)C [Alphaproteobacteria bacterium]